MVATTSAAASGAIGAGAAGEEIRTMWKTLPRDAAPRWKRRITRKRCCKSWARKGSNRFPSMEDFASSPDRDRQTEEASRDLRPAMRSNTTQGFFTKVGVL